jgi:4-carboxymuconolactone decarboxylase
VRLSLCIFLTLAIASAQDGAKQDAKQEKAKAAPKLDLRGDRFRGLTYDELTPAQKVITDRALAGRGPIGIFNITLRSPELSEAMRGIAGGRGATSAKQNELAILLTGRYWTTQFEFAVHHRAATQAGLSEATIAFIIKGRRPPGLLPDETPVYDFLTELLTTKQVSDTAFNALKASVGEKGIVDLIGLSAFYQTVSLMMNVDRYPLTAAQNAELPALVQPLPFPPAAPPPRAKVAGLLRSGRFKPLTAEEMTEPQKRLMDLMASGKLEGGTNGPLNVLLRSPELGEGILRYSAYERFHTPLAARLNELAALLTIRNWTSQFPWYALHRAGVQAGLSEAVIAAIAEGRRPAGLAADEQAVYNFCAELLRTTQMSDRVLPNGRDAAEYGSVSDAGRSRGGVAGAGESDSVEQEGGLGGRRRPRARPTAGGTLAAPRDSSGRRSPARSTACRSTYMSSGFRFGRRACRRRLAPCRSICRRRAASRRCGRREA